MTQLRRPGNTDKQYWNAQREAGLVELATYMSQSSSQHEGSKDTCSLTFTLGAIIWQVCIFKGQLWRNSSPDGRIFLLMLECYMMETHSDWIVLLVVSCSPFFVLNRRILISMNLNREFSAFLALSWNWASFSHLLFSWHETPSLCECIRLVARVCEFFFMFHINNGWHSLHFEVFISNTMDNWLEVILLFMKAGMKNNR